MSGLKIYHQVSGARCPVRACQTLGSGDLAALIEELKAKRWSRNWLALGVLDEAVEVAVSRFLAAAALEEAE